MTITSTKDGKIELSWSGWNKETPKALRQLGKFILFASAAWAMFSNQLPIHISEHTTAQINQWLLFGNGMYRFIIQWFHLEDASSQYGNFKTDEEK